MSLIAYLREKLRRRRQRLQAPEQRLMVRLARIDTHLDRIGLALRQQQLGDIVRSALPRNPLLAYGYKVYSQNDEDGLIAEILRRCGYIGPGTFVELGVGDGTENNTLNLLMEGWRGAWLGGETVRVPVDGKRLRFRQCWIDRDNVDALVRQELLALNVEQPDVVSLDLDGNDYHLTEALLRGGLRPALWVAEYNALFSATTRWIMPYNPEHTWNGTDYQGASLIAFNDLFASHDYRLVCCNAYGVNAFFVDNKRASSFSDIALDCRALYMPPNFHVYPYGGHPRDVRVIEAALRRPSE